MYGISPLQSLMTNVDTVAAAGGAIPTEYTRIAQRWSAYAELDAGQLTTRLAETIAGTGNLDDLPTLRALALAGRANPGDAAELTRDVEGSVFLALRDAYATVADSNYTALAEQFTSIGTALGKAVRVVDPATDAAAMVTATDRERKAWTDAELLALQLDDRLPALCTAAELAGLNTLTVDRQLPLVVDTTGLHRRRLWEAWDDTNARAGRWAALVSLGATIRALPDLTEYETYRRAEPIRTEYRQIGRGQLAPITVDPEDAELADAS
jgi:hypothetical protein